MRKRSRKISIGKVNIIFSNRVFYSLITFLIITIIAVGVYAVAGTTPNPGHLISNVAPPSPCSANQFLKFDGTNWVCAGVSLTETDPNVLDSVKDGVSWSELSGIPSGFSDGIDDVGSASPTITLAGLPAGSVAGFGYSNTPYVCIGTTAPLTDCNRNTVTCYSGWRGIDYGRDSGGYNYWACIKS